MAHDHPCHIRDASPALHCSVFKFGPAFFSFKPPTFQAIWMKWSSTLVDQEILGC